MKIFEILMGGGLSDGGNDGIFAAVAANMSAKKRKRVALSTYEGDCVIGVTYEKLASDATALARVVGEREPSAVLIHNVGAYEVAVTLMTVSLLGIPIILCDGSSNIEAADGMLAAFGSVFAISDSLSGRDMDISELHTAISASASGTNIGFVGKLGKECSISFCSDSRLESYGESEILHLAKEFALMSRMNGGETTLSALDPTSPVGAVCSVLAPLVSGGTAAFMKGNESISEVARLIRPNRLLGHPETAARALAAINEAERGEVALPVPFKPRKREFFSYPEELAVLARRRRLNAGHLMRLGGELRKVTVIGDTDADVSRGFFDLGIMTESVLHTEGCPFAGLRREHWRELSWRTPRGLLADVCDVGKGGVGRITLSGRGISIPYEDPVLRGCIPGKFRLDECDGISFVTDLWGCVLRNGSICVKNLKNQE